MIVLSEEDYRSGKCFADRGTIATEQKPELTINMKRTGNMILKNKDVRLHNTSITIYHVMICVYLCVCVGMSHIHVYIYIYIYISACVCVCV